MVQRRFLRRSQTVRQMPRIYGNLQKERRDWRPVWRALKLIAGLAAISTAVYAVFFGPLFRVRHVEVQGALLSDQVALTALVPTGGSMWQIPQDSIRQAMMAKQPVEAVQFLRGLPDNLRIMVTEQQPVVLWHSAGVVSLLDQSGHAFLQYPETGMPAPDSKLGAVLQLLPQVIDQQNIPVQVDQQVASALFVQFVVAVQSGVAKAVPQMPVQRVEIAETTYDVTFFLKDGPTVIMNSLADADVQVRNLARLIQQKATQTTSTVDLRIDRWAYIHE